VDLNIQVRAFKLLDSIDLMKIRHDAKQSFEKNNNERNQIMLNFTFINSSNFKEFLSLGIKTLSITILDYHMNIQRIREVLTEYKFNHMHYDQYPTLILKIRMILDYFEKMNVKPSKDVIENPREKPKENKIGFNLQKFKKRVTNKINELLEESGENEKTFLDTKFDQYNMKECKK
jgi:hypothetical protein